MKIIEEFKTFAIKGNVVDLAVGVIIGAAFGKIVTSFVEDILMPPLGLLTGGVDFSNKVIVIKESVGDVAAVTINYGMFINVLISFLIVAFSIFIVVKQMNKLIKKEEAKPKKELKASEEVVLLSEIRDLLKK